MHSHRKNRKREEIIASILYTARTRVPKIKIMYGSFLNFSQAQKYLSYLLEIGLLNMELDGKYVITNKGIEYLRCFENVQNMVKDSIEKTRLLSEIIHR